MPIPEQRTSIIVEAPAKINLTFEIIGLLPDGYHEVFTLLHSVDLFDSLEIIASKASQNEIHLKSCRSSVSGYFPMDDNNLVVKAVRAFLEHEKMAGTTCEVEIGVEKNIPIEAGLAGGSADAACALVAMNEYAGGLLSEKELLSLGSRLGADVPFAIKGGICLGSGRGDRLEKFGTIPDLDLILVKPRKLFVSTPYLFKAFDRREKIRRVEEKNSAPKGRISTTVLARTALESEDLTGFIDSLSNDFEPVFFELYPEMRELKELLIDLGCWKVVLTGSGPTMYGVAPNINKANLIARDLVADRMNNPDRACYKHGPVDSWVVKSNRLGAVLKSSDNEKGDDQI
ncbi:MAG TPA: 4-(cytidine 5'-diphospho)-2-C-methyl-D-erythritol kinase [Candidatus Melainabacteria bacterium]|nr:4-(cytidine 5'-diphospho)-2-C-methyl-D-erythritol kinase [Candidatus Melainabacteria bacterium]